MLSIIRRTTLVIDSIFLYAKLSQKGDNYMKNKYFTERERYQLESLLKVGTPVKTIAIMLDKCKATIYNEIKRGSVTFLNSDYTERIEYCADVGQRKAEYNATNKGRQLKIGNDYAFADFVTDLLKNKRYSPYAVLQHIKNSNHSFCTSVCKNTLYNYIKMGLFEGVSMTSLPMPRKTQNRHKIARSRVSLNNIVCQSIEDRDKSIMDREDFGHWEMDTVVSGRGGKGVLLVFTERMTRFEEVYKINSKSMQDVVSQLNKIERKIGYRRFKNRYKTITCDNGCEFLDAVGVSSSVISKKARTKLYYCHPYSSYERGSNENANKLIRRWIPKGADISQYSDQFIGKMQDWINNYPRQLFNGLSSIQFAKSVGIAV